MLLRFLTVLLILAVLLCWFVLRPMLKLRAVTRATSGTGTPQKARVVSAVGTGTSATGMPRFHAVLELPVPGQPPRRITVQQMIGLAPLPAPGDQVYVVADTRVKNRYYLLANRVAPAALRQEPETNQEPAQDVGANR